MIPEVIYNKRKIKTYTNKFGTFIYCDVPKDVYSLGVMVINKDSYFYQIALPEKSLCDKLYIILPIKNLNDLKMLLYSKIKY